MFNGLMCVTLAKPRFDSQIPSQILRYFNRKINQGSLGSWFIKGTKKFTFRVALMHKRKTVVKHVTLLYYCIIITSLTFNPLTNDKKNSALRISVSGKARSTTRNMRGCWFTTEPVHGLRSICKFVCHDPVGHLLGFYGRFISFT